jgi:hypothetical protein
VEAEDDGGGADGLGAHPARIKDPAKEVRIEKSLNRIR